MNLERIGLPQNILEKLKLNGYKHISQIISASTVSLLSQNFDLFEIKFILNSISTKLAPKPHTALEIFYFNDQIESKEGFRYLLTGSSTLDSALEGGIDNKSITELVGVSGTGKTQFCFSCCVESVLSSASSVSKVANNVVYIDTELKFDPMRLSKLFENRLSLRNDGTQNQVMQSIESYLDKIKVCIYLFLKSQLFFLLTCFLSGQTT